MFCNSTSRTTQEQQLREEAQSAVPRAEEQARAQLLQFSSEAEKQFLEEKSRREAFEAQIAEERAKFETEKLKMEEAMKQAGDLKVAEMERKLQEALKFADLERKQREELSTRYARGEELLARVQQEQEETAKRLAQTELDLLQAQTTAADERLKNEQLEAFYQSERERINNEYKQEELRLQQFTDSRIKEAELLLERERETLAVERTKREESEKALVDVRTKLENDQLALVDSINSTAEQRIRELNQNLQVALDINS